MEGNSFKPALNDSPPISPPNTHTQLVKARRCFYEYYYYTVCSSELLLLNDSHDSGALPLFPPPHLPLSSPLPRHRLKYFSISLCCWRPHLSWLSLATGRMMMMMILLLLSKADQPDPPTHTTALLLSFLFIHSKSLCWKRLLHYRCIFYYLIRFHRCIIQMSFFPLLYHYSCSCSCVSLHLWTAARWRQRERTWG